MISNRSLLIGILLSLPVFVYVGFGAYALWETGLFRWTWWIIPGCWLLTYGVARLWSPRQRKHPALVAPQHWTATDEAALQIVLRYQRDVDNFSPEELTDLQFYTRKAQELAESLAKHYHPKSQNFASSLTVLEILAAIRLAVEDLEIWFRDSVPGSHLVTVQQWKLLGMAPKWVRRISNAGWLASIAVNPLNAIKYFSSKLTLAPLADELRTEFLAIVYLKFLRQVGFYLIEMNSGRLRRGADRYRATFGERLPSSSPKTGESQQILAPDSVVMAVIGQVKAGKSSLINALCGTLEARTDVLPQTKTVTRHRLAIPGSEETMTILDTPGYSDSGATYAELQELQLAISEADVILLVTASNAPGKAADLEMLKKLSEHRQKNSQLKTPPIILCLSHIDLLSPMLEWSPPYDWERPQGAKETSIHDALKHVQNLFSSIIPHPIAYVPLCSDVQRHRVYNVQESLLPTLLSQLPAGKSVGLLKAYEKSLDADRYQRFLQQLQSSAQNLRSVWIEERLSAPVE